MSHSADYDAPDLFYADVHEITRAARTHVEQKAYLLTGGSDGCALCEGRSLAEKLAAGHEDCAIAWIEFQAAKRLAADLGEMWIPVSRAMSDPRMFQWVGRYDPSGSWEPRVLPPAKTSIDATEETER